MTRSLNRMAKKKQDETKHLENETKLMEQRLQLLKSVLQKDITKLTSNESGTSGTIWTGSLTNSTTEAVPKLKITADLSKFKLRTLKREPDSGKSAEEGIYSEVIKRLLNDPKCVTRNGVLAQTEAQFLQTCGQCESKKAAVSCQECNEDYCAKCFAQFHMKGALRRHHSLPLSSFTSRASVGRRKPIEEGSGDENAEPNHCIVSPRSAYTHGCEIQTSPTTKHASCTAQTESHGHIVCSSAPKIHTETRGTSSERVSSPTIQFTPSITYAERLMLRVHRRNQLPALNAANTSFQPNSEQERIESVKDFQLSSSFWQRPNFTQLHALATSDLRTEDFCIEFQIEDLENTSNLTSTDIQHPTTSEMNIGSASERTNRNVELSTHTIRERDIIQDGVLQDTTVIPKEDFARTNDNSQSLEPGVKMKNPTCWLPAHSLQPLPNRSDLATIELIKQHLNSLTQAEEASPTEKQTNGYSSLTFPKDMG
ncbi:hypothetical protein EG68_06056 [Paragonimus skrjabini miyazakii]|uniref:B box-type domain-containing protein n=1 Tax=Paragonimus skrjabini miyazakii TaxID=59628 RepID=A0A8S9YXL8_9TREM|nr:hypothetical protein EG68_06056 [Paragonimus skrjabini miyazakii]